MSKYPKVRSISRRSLHRGKLPVSGMHEQGKTWAEKTVKYSSLEDG